MATDWAAAVAKMRALVGVYTAALAKGPLTLRQTRALATDLKTLDADLAALAASLVPVPGSAYPPLLQTAGVNVDAIEAQLIAAGFATRETGEIVLGDVASITNFDLKRDACAAGFYGNPSEPIAGADYSLFTGCVGINADQVDVWRAGKLVATVPYPRDGDLGVIGAQFGITIP